MSEENMAFKATVSVIIPTYKRPEELKRAVTSVLNQSLTNIEIIVVDDNDPLDENRRQTEIVMKEYLKDSRIKYLKHQKNKNGSAARNTGIRVASGRYIAFLDDDDEYEPNRLEIMNAYMDSLDTVWGGCYSSYKKYMKDGSVQHSTESATGDLLIQALMRSLYISAGSNLFLRKTAVDDIGLFNENFARNQDLEYLVRVLKKYKLAYVNAETLMIHYDKRTVSFSFEKSMEREMMFEKTFSSFIEQLSNADRRRVRIMHGLDRMRMCIGHEKYGTAVKFLFKHKVPPSILIKYLLYLRDRKRNSTCYGFMF